MGLHIKVKNNLNFNCILVFPINVLNGRESLEVIVRKRIKKKERIKPIILLIIMILGKKEKGKGREGKNRRENWWKECLVEREREREIVESDYFLFGPTKT